MSKISEQRRQEILRAALTEFSANGIDGASMSEIAARAGIGKSTIYEYFPSKLDLFTAVGKQRIHELERQVHDIFLRDVSFEERMTAYCGEASRCTEGLDLNTIARLFFRETAGELISAMEELQVRTATDMECAIRRAQAAGELLADLDVHTTALYLLTLPNPHISRSLLNSGRKEPERELVKLALFGIAARRD